MHRRTLLGGTALLPLPFTAGRAATTEPQGIPFSADTVRDAARDLATKPFQPQETALPSYLANISYDQYRMLRFDKAHALWRGANLPWQIEFFHRGSIYKGRVDVNEVVDGRSLPVHYSPDQDRVPTRGVGLATSSRSPAGLAGVVRQPRRAA